MASEKLSVEQHFVLYQNQLGYSFTLRPDRDGLGLVELIYRDNAQEKSITFTNGELIAFHKMLTRFIEAAPKKVLDTPL